MGSMGIRVTAVIGTKWVMGKGTVGRHESSSRAGKRHRRLQVHKELKNTVGGSIYIYIFYNIYLFI